MTSATGLDSEAVAAYESLESQLKAQIDTAMVAKQQAHTQGQKDLAVAFYKDQRRFEQDLEVVRTARRRGEAVPLYHYEDRTFTRVISFPDIHEAELEVAVLQGHSLPPPAGYTTLDTHVTLELDFPKDEPQVATSPAIKRNLFPGTAPAWSMTRVRAHTR